MDTDRAVEAPTERVTDVVGRQAIRARTLFVVVVMEDDTVAGALLDFTGTRNIDTFGVAPTTARTTLETSTLAVRIHPVNQYRVARTIDTDCKERRSIPRILVRMTIYSVASERIAKLRDSECSSNLLAVGHQPRNELARFPRWRRTLEHARLLLRRVLVIRRLRKAPKKKDAARSRICSSRSSLG